MTNHARGAYRSSTALGWTRVDMLLALYGATLNALHSGIEALEQQQMARHCAARLNVQRLVLGLIEGLDLEQGDIPRNVFRLCLYVWDQVQSDDVTKWQAAVDVIQTLQRGFEAIADAAREQERSGVIPPLSQLVG